MQVCKPGDLPRDGIWNCPVGTFECSGIFRKISAGIYIRRRVLPDIDAAKSRMRSFKHRSEKHEMVVFDLTANLLEPRDTAGRVGYKPRMPGERFVPRPADAT